MIVSAKMRGSVRECFWISNATKLWQKLFFLIFKLQDPDRVLPRGHFDSLESFSTLDFLEVPPEQIFICKHNFFVYSCVYKTQIQSW